MTQRTGWKALSGSVLVTLLLAACGTSTTTSSETLAADQTLRFPVKADDLLYSWNRAALAGDAYAANFSPIVGYDAVSAKVPTSKTLSGLTKTDDYTVVAKLSAPAGWWLSALALGGVSWVIDQKVVTAKGEDTWWTTPDGLVATGPFKMTARVPKASLDFAPVANWWGGSTGAIKHVHVDVIADQASWVTK